MENIKSGTTAINEILKYSFVIPGYQRGYRWTENQVKDLLDDVLDFSKKEKSRNEFYCLQPIVVSKSNIENEFNVIDGQQRLTTIHIILSYLEELVTVLGKSKFKIQYNTRKDSQEFLDSIDTNKANDNIDFFHMVQAYITIKNWFEQRDGSIKLNFLNALLGEEGNNVRVIWYELDSKTEPIDVFTRLNMGKIGLTNSELLKALILSKSVQNESTTEKGQFIHTQEEIAAEWDHYETELRKDEFWGFLQNDSVKYDNHIELLFDLIADNYSKDGKQTDRDKFHTYRYFSSKISSQSEAISQWNEVKSLFQLLHDWYSDKILYHLIGFLISAGENLIEIIELAKGKTKSVFLLEIRELITDNIPEAADVSKLSYYNGSERHELRRTLLLFNVLSILENPKTNLRFQFGRYKLENWDIEHIDSVKSGIPTSPAHQFDWLKEVANYTDNAVLKSKIKKYIETTSKQRTETFEDLYSEIIKLYSGDEVNDVNDISNLTLLDSSTNRGYKNAIFPIKRKTIIERDQTGTFVPLCTKNVFLKYYNKNLEQTTFWGANDRETYKKQLVDTIENFINGKLYEN